MEMIDNTTLPGDCFGVPGSGASSAVTGRCGLSSVGCSRTKCSACVCVRVCVRAYVCAGTDSFGSDVFNVFVFYILKLLTNSTSFPRLIIRPCT